MKNVFNAGRIFYGLGIAGLGFQSIYTGALPYMLLPPNYATGAGLAILLYVVGGLFILAGLCITANINTRLAGIVPGTFLLLLFCICYLPYQFFTTTNYAHLITWDNPCKELALAGGALIISGGSDNATGKTGFMQMLAKLRPAGTYVFALAIIVFGSCHFVYAGGVAEYIPTWVPNRVLWAYIAGVPLLGCGIAMLLNVKRRLAAVILGAVILTWFIILHIPKVINATLDDRAAEITSALIALAYSGTAFVVAGLGKRVEEA